MLSFKRSTVTAFGAGVLLFAGVFGTAQGAFAAVPAGGASQASASQSAAPSIRPTTNDPSTPLPRVDDSQYVSHEKIHPLAVGSCVTTTTFGVGGGKYAVIPTTSSGSRDCLMDQGYQNSAVSKLQQNLKDQCEIVNGSLVVDGVFGPATTSALEADQSMHGWSVDGVYGTQVASGMYWITTDGTQCVHIGI